MPNLSYRRARLEDVADLVRLINSAYRGDSSRAGWTTEADFLGGQRTDAEEVRELIEAPDSVILLCCDGADLLGSVHLARTGPGAYLGMFTVAPARQGKGIGKRFLAEAERTARELWGVERVRMQVITRRHELIAFYERRGYRRTGELSPFPTDRRFGIPKVANLRFEVLEKTL